MRADGSIVPVELGITRIDVPGPPTFTGYLRDITDRKAAEAELRESRARIVEAGDDARRRIERDLHDGAQQRLTTVALMLRSARGQLDGAANPAVLDTLARAVDELKDGLAELRAPARASRTPMSWPPVRGSRLHRRVTPSARPRNTLPPATFIAWSPPPARLHCAPPSTARMAPVVKLDASLAK
jgi:Histidine kinase